MFCGPWWVPQGTCGQGLNSPATTLRARPRVPRVLPLTLRPSHRVPPLKLRPSHPGPAPHALPLTPGPAPHAPPLIPRSRPSRSTPLIPGSAPHAPPLTPGPAHHTGSCPSRSAPQTRAPPLTVRAPHTWSYPSRSMLTPGSSTSGAALQPETWKRTIQGCKPCPSSCANFAAQWVDFMNQTPSSRSISCKGRDSCYFCAKLIELRSKNSLRDLLLQLQFRCAEGAAGGGTSVLWTHP